MSRTGTPLLLWPFAALLDLLALLLRLTGRLVLFVVGAALLLVAGVLTLTVVLIPVAVPLAIIGFVLVLRSIF